MKNKSIITAYFAILITLSTALSVMVNCTGVTTTAPGGTSSSTTTTISGSTTTVPPTTTTSVSGTTTTLPATTTTTVASIIDLVTVTGNTFRMGWDGVAEPTHDVTVSDFVLAKYEVTNTEVVTILNWALAQDLIDATADVTVTNSSGDSQELIDLDNADCQIKYNGTTFSVKTGLGDDGAGGSVDLSNYPCIAITWYGAAAGSNYLSQMEGLTPCYDLSDWSLTITNNGYRLPTEAEWEYAARYIDGTNWRDGDKYSGSDVLDDVAWYQTNSNTTPHSNIGGGGSGTHQIGLKTANDLGLHDMTGNVMEWCHDWYDDYTSSPVTDPTGPATGSSHILRGASWLYVPLVCTVAYHDLMMSPASVDSGVGFRLCRRP